MGRKYSGQHDLDEFKDLTYQRLMEMVPALLIATIILTILYKYCWREKKHRNYQSSSRQRAADNSLLRMFKVPHVNAIVDQFTSLDQVSGALRKAGLESSNLIFGVDYTASNMHQGTKTFQGQCLHSMASGAENPYQQVINVLGRTLSPFDEDGLIPAFGFGDVSTKDRSVFPFRAEGYCTGFEDVLSAYNQITPTVKFSGPTNFAPLIHQAIEIVKSTKAYHILVIIADGQVTSERPTSEAIVEASKWPLSIVLVGVGDGPWETMYHYDDELPQRKFDNFQFVDYNRVLTYSAGNPDQVFALHALMEIPDQYKVIRKMGLLDF